MTGGPVGVGLIGAGTISDTYLTNLTSFPDVTVRMVSDLDVERAATQAAKYGVPSAGTVAELLSDPGIEIVVNLTIPAAHVDIGIAALDSGKHVWTEKPLALDRPSARKLLDRAREKGLRVASAPDTVLGAGLQTVRRVVDAGRIGVPQSALALFQSSGPERWHPAPEFLFQSGGGPLLDIGPYYLTQLATVMGSVARVTAAGGRGRDTRMIGSGPRAGVEFAVTVPTTVNALLEFAEGGSAQVLFSFDSALRRTTLEVTGTLGSLVLPDPNRFDGFTQLYLTDLEQPIELPPEGHQATRGTGVLELARAIRSEVPERASGDIAYHVLDVMLAIEESLASRHTVGVESRLRVPSPLPADWDPYARTL